MQSFRWPTSDSGEAWQRPPLLDAFGNVRRPARLPDRLPVCFFRSQYWHGGVWSGFGERERHRK